jgi:fermentation-respiration switch protein FrsA (DUF1100 family)
MVDGWAQFHRIMPQPTGFAMDAMFAADRLGRAAGQPAILLPLINDDPTGPSVLSGPENFKYLSEWEKTSLWKNEVTLKSVEAFRGYSPTALIDQISPTPLLMVLAENDAVSPVDLAMKAYRRAAEPKSVVFFPGGHIDAFSDDNFQYVTSIETEFLRRTLCKEGKFKVPLDGLEHFGMLKE